MNEEKNLKLEQLLSNSDSYSLVVETIIKNIIKDKKINFDTSLSVINELFEILKNNKIELDDNIISELVSLNGYFVQIINCISEHLDKINDESILLVIKTVSEFNNIKLEDIRYDNSDNYQLVDGVKEYINSINSIPLLSIEKEIELATKMKNGDKIARKKFIESNLRLVVDIVKKYNGYGLSYLDLIQEGNLALIFAVDRFDVTLGYRFSTFATIIINQKVSRAIHFKGSQIRLPEYINKKLIILKKTYVYLYNKLGRDISYLDLSKELEISVEEIEYLYSLQNSTLSLNTKLNDEDDIEIMDLIPSLDNIEDEYLKKDLLEKMLLLIDKSNLSDKEKNVILLRYGFVGEKIWTLKEIGKIYNVSGERIRQIEDRALRKIRKSKNLKKIDDYLLKPGKSYNKK